MLAVLNIYSSEGAKVRFCYVRPVKNAQLIGPSSNNRIEPAYLRAVIEVNVRREYKASYMRRRDCRAAGGVVRHAWRSRNRPMERWV